MILNELFKPKKTVPLFEGGNLELPNPNDPTAPYQADEIDLKVQNRSFMVGLLDKLLNDINGAFYSKYKKPLWNPNLLQSKQFLGGSSLHFFNTDGISDKEFTKHKPKVGDIDTQCNKELEPEIRDFLTAYDHKQIGDTTLLGFSQGSEQLNALFQFQDPPIKIQIDFEFGRYDTETDMPDEWYRFSHSSEWNDIQAGIKGVFHKYIYRALTSAHSSVKHQVDVKKTKTNIKPNVRDNDLSFAVASGQGGGLSQKYEPYINTDPETGEKQTHKDEVPYKRLIPSAQRTYIQNLDKQFYYFFGANPEGNDKELQKSFLGTLELINKYIPDPASKESVFMAFLDLCFEPGNAQMITKNDPERDQEIKFAAIDNFVKVGKLGKLRNTAIEMGKAYMDEFNEVQAYKKEHPEEKQPRAALKRAKAASQPANENFADTQTLEERRNKKRKARHAAYGPGLYGGYGYYADYSGDSSGDGGGGDGGGESIKNEDAMMGKIADSGKIIRILKKAHTVPFSDEKNWLLVDMDPAKGNNGLGIKWIPADTRFTWVRPYRDNVGQGVAEGATVTRIDSNPITDFGSSLKAYKHTDDWSQSGVDTGDDSYWKNKNLKTNTTKGLFAGDPRRTALYATGNAHETRYVEFTQNGQPIVYFDRKDLPAMRSRKTYLTVFDASDFRQLPTGEWFSENPSKPIKQVPIGDPFKYIADQGWIVRVTDDLDKVFKQVKNMHKAGKIAQYGAEGMNESKQGVAENFADGKNPQDKGDSKRHGVPTKASISTLRNVAKQGGRKGQLAHWMANMKAGKAKHESLNEAEVKAQLRKGMPHLKDLKAADFLDLLDEIHDGNGNFKLENMPLNVKVDGFGGRFGKNADGKPFMGTSRTEPRYAPGFVKYHQEKGTQDPEILGRAKLFDDLFVEMMNAVKLVDSKLGPDFLIDKQVSCEVLFLPFATETEEGKLKFVGIHYDKLPQGVQLALVPLNVVTASTGEPVENSQEVIKELTGLGQQSSVMFIDNSLTQNKALDVTAIVPPLENIEELKSIVSDTAGKRDRTSLELRKNVEAQLQPVKLALEKAIAEDPNIVGKDMLGKDYEGIVLNTRLGPVKITSTEQRAVIAGKQAAKTSARTERPRGESKTAVVAIGSFIGHKGHEELFNYTINKASELGGDPYLFIGNAEGKDDPIPPAVKVQTWHKLYPEYAKNISTVQQGGQLIQKIKHELINPLPNKPPRYDNIVIMVGEDRKDLNMPQALMKAVNKFQGYEHVKVSLGVTPRGTGISGTMLRNSLKSDPPEKALAVWSNAFDVKKLGEDWINHLMDITRKGMGIQQQTQQQPAPVAERLFNALMAPKVNESTSLESTIKNIVTNGESIAQLYEKLKAMAKRWVDNNGSLKGYHRNAAGQSAQWFNNFYWNKMQGDLYDLTKQASKYAPPLLAFLKDASEDRERHINFREISSSLPSILQQIGTRMGNKELSSFGANWNKRQQDYENYLAQIEAEVDTDDDDGYEEPKAPKDNTFGKQNVQADQIVNDILKNLPSKVAGDIRNAIARSPNKLQALQAELQKRGVKAPMAESLIESARMSAAVKLQRAWEREQAKSTASRKRGEEYMNQIKQDVANKNKKPDETKDESIMGFLATPKHSIEKKSTTSSADMRKYFEKDKPSKPEKTERGDGGEKIQRVYTRSDEDQETPQQQQVRAAITKGLEVHKQKGDAEYKTRLDRSNKVGTVPGHYFDPRGYASDKLSGIDSIDPNGTVVISLQDTSAEGWIKKLATLGGMPGVKTRQIQPGQGVAEDNLNELDMFAPRTVYFKMGDGNYIKADYRGSETIFGGGHKANDQVNFTSMSWVSTNTARSLGLDKTLAKGSDPNDTRSRNAQSIVSPQYVGQAGPWGNRSVDVVDFVNSKEETVPSELKTQVAQWVEKNRPKKGVAEGNLKEFAPGPGGGESGRWYTDDQLTDIVGDGWYNDLDVSGDIPKQQMIQQAQAWLDDQGYNVQVLNCKVNDDDMEWYIEGSFQNSRFAKKGVAENNPAAGINKMFNNLGDPVYANLQRVALLAMQGRQQEASGRLQTVIKDADPAVQKKITDAVNNIKPVTINGRAADSSTLDKSKQHNDWIINTFIPWVQSLLGKQGVAEGSSGAKYKVRSIGQDKKGEYYISPSTGEKVYKKAKVGDHEVPNTKEIKPKVEAMMPASNFAGSKKNKLGTAGQLKATAKHARAGDLVGSAESIQSEDQRLDPKCWKGYRKQGTKMKGGTRVNNCVKVSEDIENKMSDLIRLLENK